MKGKVTVKVGCVLTRCFLIEDHFPNWKWRADVSNSPNSTFLPFAVPCQWPPSTQKVPLCHWVCVLNLGTSGKDWGRPGFSQEHTVQSMQTTCACKKKNHAFNRKAKLNLGCRFAERDLFWTWENQTQEFCLSCFWSVWWVLSERMAESAGKRPGRRLPTCRYRMPEVCGRAPKAACLSTGVRRAHGRWGSSTEMSWVWQKAACSG